MKSYQLLRILIVSLVLFKAEIGANKCFAAGVSILTPEEKEIYYGGEIGDGRRLVGGFLGTFCGFGTGHVITGFYRDVG